MFKLSIHEKIENEREKVYLCRKDMFHLLIYKGMEKIISNKVRKNLNEHTARIILERSDRMASSTLEQLRKSTDRAYTMTGFLLTVFIALTAFVFSSPSLW